MTLNEIEVLLHCHISNNVHPRISASAVSGAIEYFLKLKVIRPTTQLNVYNTTERGEAWIKVLCKTPIPRIAYLDSRDKEIV